MSSVDVSNMQTTYNSLESTYNGLSSTEKNSASGRRMASNLQQMNGILSKAPDSITSADQAEFNGYAAGTTTIGDRLTMPPPNNSFGSQPSSGIFEASAGMLAAILNKVMSKQAQVGYKTNMVATQVQEQAINVATASYNADMNAASDQMNAAITGAALSGASETAAGIAQGKGASERSSGADSVMNASKARNAGKNTTGTLGSQSDTPPGPPPVGSTSPGEVELTPTETATGKPVADGPSDVSPAAPSRASSAGNLSSSERASGDSSSLPRTRSAGAQPSKDSAPLTPADREAATSEGTTTTPAAEDSKADAGDKPTATKGAADKKAAKKNKKIAGTSVSKQDLVGMDDKTFANHVHSINTMLQARGDSYNALATITNAVGKNTSDATKGAIQRSADEERASAQFARTAQSQLDKGAGDLRASANQSSQLIQSLGQTMNQATQIAAQSNQKG